MSVGKCTSASTVRNGKCMPSEQKWGWKITPAWMHLTVIFIHSELQCIWVMHFASMCVPGNQTHDLDLFVACWAPGTEAGMTSTSWAYFSLNSASVFSYCISSQFWIIKPPVYVIQNKTSHEHKSCLCALLSLLWSRFQRVIVNMIILRKSWTSVCSGRIHCYKASRLL